MKSPLFHWDDKTAELLRRLALAGHTMSTAATSIGCTLAAVRSRTIVDDINWYPKRSAPVLRAWVGDEMESAAARVSALNRAKKDLAQEIALAKKEAASAPLYRPRTSGR